MENLLTTFLSQARGGRNSQRHRFQPRLEILEDRLTPATIAVTTFADVVNPNDGKVSLREAIIRANATSAHDTIVLKAGVYKISSGVAGAFEIEKSVTLVGTGAGSTVINAAQNDRVFAVTGTSPGSIGVGFQSLTVTGGKVAGDGGGILMGNANVWLRDCIVTGNAAYHGAGISNAGAAGTGHLKLVRTTVNANHAEDDGGGIYLMGNQQNLGSTLNLVSSTVRGNTAGFSGAGIRATTAILTGSVVRGNTAGDKGGGIRAVTVSLIDSTVHGNKGYNGGGISAGMVNLTNSTVSGNNAGDGGGIYAGTANLTRSTVHGNTAGVYGGGIYASVAVLDKSTVSGNKAGASGGGLRAVTATVTNSTVSGNTATGADGGGILAGSMTLLNATIVKNTAVNGGGVFHFGADPATVKNTIIALNQVTAGGEGPDVHGTFTSLGHNLIGNPTGSTGFGVMGDRLGTAQKPLDPKLSPLQNNGGPTLTHALLAGSPAIDRGDNAGAPGLDQRGVGRPRDGDFNLTRIVDIGAFER